MFPPSATVLSHRARTQIPPGPLTPGPRADSAGPGFSRTMTRAHAPTE